MSHGLQNTGRLLLEGLDLLFPPSCVVCRELSEIETEGMICRRCFAGIFQPASIPAPFPLWAAGDYSGPLRDLIHRAKFSADPLPLAALVSLLRRTVETTIRRPFDLVASVPGSSRRIRERGIDLPGLLARRLAKKVGVPFSGRILGRTRQTEAQTSLSREDRLANLTGVFSAERDTSFEHLLVVDDVVTTGATASAVSEAFPPDRRPSVTFLALARTTNRISDMEAV
jgi:ComF family protein